MIARVGCRHRSTFFVALALMLCSGCALPKTEPAEGPELPPACSPFVARADSLRTGQHEPPLVLVVSGHQAAGEARGALSVTGRYENEYNDTVVRMVKQMTAPGGEITYKVFDSYHNLSLRARVDSANILTPQPVLYIEVHHDSAEEEHRAQAQREGAGSNIAQLMRGFSIHYSTDQNEDASAALCFAQLLGDTMLAQGFVPNLYHAVYPENRPLQLVDRRRGIYNRVRPNGLFVLRGVSMPAVVFEVGSIAEAQEERHLQTEQTHQQVGAAITTAVKRYLGY